MDSNWKRLLIYLVLNLVISVCATASVLFIYDRFYRHPVSRTSANLPVTQASSVELESAKMEITTVVGAGLLESEMVVLRNAGPSQVDLTGWKLKDEDANTYPFGALTLPPGGAVQLHTTSGPSTLIDHYWGLTVPAWRSGETVTLLDLAGAVRSVYKVP